MSQFLSRDPPATSINGLFPEKHIVGVSLNVWRIMYSCFGCGQNVLLDWLLSVFFCQTRLCFTLCPLATPSNGFFPEKHSVRFLSLSYTLCIHALGMVIIWYWTGFWVFLFFLLDIPPDVIPDRSHTGIKLCRTRELLLHLFGLNGSILLLFGDETKYFFVDTIV